jgi:hypothetical protein
MEKQEFSYRSLREDVTNQDSPGILTNILSVLFPCCCEVEEEQHQNYEIQNLIPNGEPVIKLLLLGKVKKN